MSNPNIKIKRSGVAGKVPTVDQLPLGEFAINTYDGKVFIAKNAGVSTEIVEVGISTEAVLSGIITATNLEVTNTISGISSGAAKVETATDAGNQWHHVGFLDNRTGYQKIKTNGLTYNPSTGKLYAGIGSFGSVTGDLTGNVNAGVVTATSFVGDGSQLTGIVASSTPTEENFTATQGQTVFTTTTSTDAKLLSIYFNGVKLKSTDFTQGSNGFTLTTSAQSGDELDCIIYPAATGEGSVVATQGQTVVTSPETFTAVNFLIVFINGVKQRLTTDYTRNNSNSSITFTTALNAGDEVDIVIT